MNLRASLLKSKLMMNLVEKDRRNSTADRKPKIKKMLSKKLMTILSNCRLRSPLRRRKKIDALRSMLRRRRLLIT